MQLKGYFSQEQSKLRNILPFLPQATDWSKSKPISLTNSFSLDGISVHQALSLISVTFKDKLEELASISLVLA